MSGVDGPVPRRWWESPLDVERLAWRSVTAARDAAQELSDLRGQGHDVSTTSALVAGSFAAIDHLRVDGRPAQAWAPLSGFFPTADGWVRTHANYPHHAQALEHALGARDRETLTARLATMTAAGVEQRVTAARGIAVRVRSPQEWADSRQGRAVEQHDIGVGQQALGKGIRVEIPCSRSLAHAGGEVLIEQLGTLGGIDAQHVGAQACEQLRARRSGDDPRQVEHADAVQG